jgi:hypothetical protein
VSKNKKVTFNLKPCIIIIPFEDRKGPWETFAIDRYRFHQRALKVEQQIKWCFEPSHRNKIIQNKSMK